MSSAVIQPFIENDIVDTEYGRGKVKEYLADDRMVVVVFKATEGVFSEHDVKLVKRHTKKPYGASNTQLDGVIYTMPILDVQTTSSSGNSYDDYIAKYGGSNEED